MGHLTVAKGQAVRGAVPMGAPTNGRRRSGADGSTIVFVIAVVLLLVIVGYPLLWLLMASFGVPGKLELSYLADVYSRSQNLAPLVNTLILALGAGIVSVVVGVPLAWATARTDMPFRRTIQVLVALTYITPPYLTAIAYIILLGPDAGYFNRPLQALFGLTRGPLDIFTMGGVIFVIGMHVFPFTYFMTHSALRSVDASYEEAARLLGARRLGVMFRVNLPLVAPAITGGALLSAIESMALFGPQAFLGLPAQITFLPTRIYGVIGAYPPRWSEASALSLTLVVLTAIGLMLQRGYLERRSHTTISGRGLRVEVSPLGGWKWALLAFCAAALFLSALAPIAVLVIAAFTKNWVAGLVPANLTLGNFDQALIHNQIAVRGILNSFQLAVGAGICAVVIGAVVAYLDLRTRAVGRRLLDYLAILPLGLPGTVMAVAVMLAFIRPPFAIYGTIWILLVAYIARFVPLATRSANTTLRQIDPSLEEAARIAGATRMGALGRILLPLSRPGLVVAFLLVFIPALSELSATILLYTGGTETISVAIFRLNDLGQLEVVSALSVFIIVVTLLVSLPLNLLSNRSRITPSGDGAAV
jgi:iron(III) transport system permease protein